MCVVPCLSLSAVTCLSCVSVACGLLMAAGCSVFDVRCSLFAVCC